MADLLISIVGDASKLKGALDNASGHVTGFSQKLGKVGKVATVGGLAITAAFTKTFLDFTAYETKLIDMAKVTSEPFDQIEAKLKTIDPMIGSSTELMGGYYQVISAGVKDPVRALETLTVAAEAGKAAHVAQSEVVKGITKMMAGYEGAIRDASEAADLLFAIEKEGQTTVAELIPVIGGLAKISFDLNIEQTAMAASMAVISKTAGTTAEATTQYQAVLTGLMKPTEDMTLAMDDMGYASAELAIEEEGLVEVLKHLEEYSGRTGVSMAKLFGRKEAMLGFSALGAEGFRVLDETIVSVGKGAGGAEKAFLEWSESGAAAIDKIKNTFLNFSIMIGEKVAPMIKNILGKVTEVITRVIEWADENEELTEKLFTFGLALGAALAVLGPIAVLLPSLITGFTLLAPAMLPLAIGGVIVLGIKKLSEYLRETVGGMREFRAELEGMELDAIDAEIKELTDTVEQLQKRFYEIPEGVGRQQILTMMDEINERMGILYERREELTKAEEAGIDVAEERAKLDEEEIALKEELALKMEEERKAIEEKIKAAERATAQMEIEDKMYALTHTAIEVQIKDLYELAMKWQAAGVSMDLVKEYVELATEAIYKQNEAIEEHIDIMEEVALVTKEVEDRWFELTHLPYEVKIKNINEKYDEYIKKVRESTVSILAQETAIRNINLVRDEELIRVDRVTEAEKKAKRQKDILIDTYKEIEDKIYELTHTAMEYQIKKLEEERQAYIDLEIELEVVDKLFDLQIAKLSDVGDAFTGLQETVKPVITAITGYLENQLANAISGLLGGMGDFEWSWSNFWTGLKNVLINAVVAMIAKLIILASFSWLFALIGWVWPFEKGGGIGYDSGGGIGYDLGGKVKGYQPGGVADTVPARLTIGEYVIAKPMTDFVRQFRAIPGNLVDAIVKGLPTPTPAFAGGGLVGSSNVSASGFGGNKIYIDIHGNYIADDVDIKKLATKVSDEILRKLNLNRRH